MKYLVYYGGEFNDSVCHVLNNNGFSTFTYTKNIKYAKQFKSKEKAIEVLKKIYDTSFDNWMTCITVATKDEFLIKNIIE